MFESVIRNDEIGPAVFDFGGRGHGADAVAFGGVAGDGIDFDAEFFAAVKMVEQIAAAAAEIEHPHVVADEGRKFGEIRPAAEASDFGLPVEVFAAVMRGGPGGGYDVRSGFRLYDKWCGHGRLSNWIDGAISVSVIV